MDKKMGFFVETASEKGFAGIYEGPRLLESVRFHSADQLMPEIERLFTLARIEPEALAYVGAGIGPGSFTGIRIGVMAARAFSFALKIPSVGLSSLSLYGEEMPVLADARIGGVWGQFPGQEPELIATQHLSEALRGVKAVLSPDLKILKEKLLQIGFEGEIREGAPDGERIGTLLFEAFKKSKGDVPSILYLRKTQAEVEKLLSKSEFKNCTRSS